MAKEKERGDARAVLTGKQPIEDRAKGKELAAARAG